MTMFALSATNADVPTSGEWLLSVMVVDLDGNPADVTPTITVTLPDGTAGVAPTLEQLAGGCYRAAYAPALAGRYVARIVAAGYGAVDFVAWVAAPVAGNAMPDLQDCKDYLTDGEHSYTDGEISDALAAEAANQRGACQVPAVYPDDLRQALLRRVQRNLAMRRLPLAVLRGDGEGGDATLLPGRDPEVRRFERNHPKLPTG